MTNSDAGRRFPRRRVATAAAVLAAAAVLSAVTLLAVRWAAGPGARAADGSSRSGIGFFAIRRPATNLDLAPLHGGATIDVAKLAGKPIVLNFWSSSCDPCRKETPALASVARAIGGKVNFVGIDTADLRGPAEAFVARYKVPYPIAFDPKASAAGKYGLVGLPVTIFLSPSARTVVGENVGALTSSSLHSILRRLYGIG